MPVGATLHERGAYFQYHFQIASLGTGDIRDWTFWVQFQFGVYFGDHLKRHVATTRSTDGPSDLGCLGGYPFGWPSASIGPYISSQVVVTSDHPAALTRGGLLSDPLLTE